MEQLRLFEGGVDVSRLREVARAFTERSRAAATELAYASDWRIFEAWCSAAGRGSLPASDETLSLFLADELGRRAVSTCDRRVAAIVDRHLRSSQCSPVGLQSLGVLRGAYRERGTAPNCRAALCSEDVRRICKLLGKDRQAVRDRALLLLGFAGGFRCSELVALDLSDVRFVRKGLIVRVRRSKTDQEGRGRELGIWRGGRLYSCPVENLRAWLALRGVMDGPLFAGRSSGRLCTRSVNLVVKRAVVLAGLDPSRYGSHSLRAGFVTACAENGEPETLIMQRTGHRSVQTVARYVRPVRLFSSDALAGCL